MKKYITGIALVLSFLFLTGTITATEIRSARINHNQVFIKKTAETNPIFLDMVRCTCGGEACSSSFESHPNASIGGLIAYCARTCSCNKNVGFRYETEQ